jgi:hypothetical protein
LFGKKNMSLCILECEYIPKVIEIIFNLYETCSMPFHM